MEKFCCFPEVNCSASLQLHCAPVSAVKMEGVTELCGVVISPYPRRTKGCKVIVSQAETFTFL